MKKDTYHIRKDNKRVGSQVQVTKPVECIKVGWEFSQIVVRECESVLTERHNRRQNRRHTHLVTIPSSSRSSLPILDSSVAASSVTSPICLRLKSRVLPASAEAATALAMRAESSGTDAERTRECDWRDGVFESPGAGMAKLRDMPRSLLSTERQVHPTFWSGYNTHKHCAQTHPPTRPCRAQRKSLGYIDFVRFGTFA